MKIKIYLTAIFTFLLTASSCHTAKAEEHEPVIYTAAPNPDVPESVSFCGEEISLDRADMYERFDRELTSFVYGHGNSLLMLKRANKYFPVMAPILKSNGIPEDFLYLACAESFLNHRAYSSAKAAGVWQFIAATAQQYGLEVSDEVDERYNLEKATQAACKFFKSAYRKYGDWPTVMASFNGGMGRISTELDKQMRNNAFDLYLTEETSRYMFRIMAIKEIFGNPAKYGFKLRPDQFYQPVEYETVTVNGPVEDWAVWADGYGISYAQLREENPWIRAKKLTNKSGKTYEVKIPKKESLSRKEAGTTLYDPAWAIKQTD